MKRSDRDEDGDRRFLRLPRFGGNILPVQSFSTPAPPKREARQSANVQNESPALYANTARWAGHLSQ